MTHHTTILNAEKLPITAHIFEGHLYTKDDKTSKWLWRLFRFDGTSLTCLSSKKNKLPPHTSLASHGRPITSVTQSASTHSFTSPILATPKHRTDRIFAGSCSAMKTATDGKNSNRNAQPISVSYYQLPKWTVDMINIHSISLLKPKQKESKTFKKYNFTAPASNSKSFTIRTFDGACYTLKASKQQDLERWIFVLVKMWTIAQATRQMHGDSIVPHSNHTALAGGGSGSNNQMTSPNQPMRALIASHVGQQQSSSHHDTMLSNEKTLFIEKWLESLAELETYSSDMVDIPSKRASSRPHQQPLPQLGNDVRSSHPSQTHNQSNSNQSSSTSNNSARIPTTTITTTTRHNFDYMGYFRDVNTNNNTKGPKQSLKYHDTVRARPIQIYTAAHDMPVFLSAATLSHHPQTIEYGCSPMDTLLTKLSCSQHTSVLSPQVTPAVAALESDEDVCLADVCKSLQIMEIDKMQAEQESTGKRRSTTTFANASRNE